MSDHYSAGSVWWCLHDFRRGKGPQEKFFVLLTDCPPAGDGLLALATSVGRHYHGMGSSPCGLPTVPCFRIESHDEKCFNLTTYIQFDQLAATNRTLLLGHTTSGTGRFVQAMDPQRFRSLLACMKKSEDIPVETLDAITKTLKLLSAAAKAPPSKTARRADQIVHALPPVVTGVAAVRIKFDGRCVTCRAQFAEVMVGSVDALASVFSEAKSPPEGFLDSSDDGFSMARELAGDRCTCAVKLR